MVSAAAASQHEDHEYASLWEGFGLVWVVLGCVRVNWVGFGWVDLVLIVLGWLWLAWVDLGSAMLGCVVLGALPAAAAVSTDVT